MTSSSLLTVDRKSSSESMPVTGVGGAGSGFCSLRVAVRLLVVLRADEDDESVILASAAFRFLVMGGILSAVQDGVSQKMPVNLRRANTVKTAGGMVGSSFG